MKTKTLLFFLIQLINVFYRIHFISFYYVNVVPGMKQAIYERIRNTHHSTRKMHYHGIKSKASVQSLIESELFYSRNNSYKVILHGTFVFFTLLCKAQRELYSFFRRIIFISMNERTNNSYISVPIQLYSYAKIRAQNYVGLHNHCAIKTNALSCSHQYWKFYV